jgi:hypothetical protein
MEEMAMAVKAHIVKVIWINSARGKRLTVTTAMMETRNPKDEYTSDTAVL